MTGEFCSRCGWWARSWKSGNARLRRIVKNYKKTGRRHEHARRKNKKAKLDSDERNFSSDGNMPAAFACGTGKRAGDAKLRRRKRRRPRHRGALAGGARP